MRIKKKWMAIAMTSIFTCSLLVGCGSKHEVKQNKVEASKESGNKDTTKVNDSVKKMSFADKSVQLPPEYLFSQEPDTTYKQEEIVSEDWSSSNPEYVNVDVNTGDVTALKAGTGKEVTITVVHKLKDGTEVEGSYQVKVQERAKKLVFTSQKHVALIGKTVKLEAKCTPSSSNSQELKWSTSNKNYAVVTAEGVVKAKKAGYGKTVTITVATTDGSNLKKKMKLRILDPNKPMVAMTFDDGPSYESTKIIVDTLKKYDARATFFVVGQNITAQNVKNREILKESAKNGNEIASHTYDHADLRTLSVSGIQQEVSKTSDLIKEVTGKSPTLLRPPYGAINDTVSATVGMPMILWSVDTLDWQTRNTDSDIRAVMSGAKDGAVILMHDIHMPSAKAVEVVVPRLVDQGFQLVTISELAESKGITLEVGKRYGSMHAS